MKIRNIILKINSYLVNLKFKMLFSSHYKLKHYMLLNIRIFGIKNNSLIGNNGSIKKCIITFIGNNNCIISNGHISKSCIKINGHNNTIELQENTHINNTTIFVKGENCHIKIGKATTIGSSYLVCMGNKNSITIGEDCMLADNIEIWSSDTHPIININNEVINPSQPINIGNHVWIGKYSKILKGVTIGSNAITGMGTVVTKNIAPHTLNVGIPNQTIKTNINWERQHITI